MLNAIIMLCNISFVVHYNTTHLKFSSTLNDTLGNVFLR